MEGLTTMELQQPQLPVMDYQLQQLMEQLHTLMVLLEVLLHMEPLHTNLVLTLLLTIHHLHPHLHILMRQSKLQLSVEGI